MEVVWGITAVGAGGLFALGTGLMSLSHAPPLLVRGCFGFSALWACVVGLWWLSTSRETVPVRCVASVLLGVFVFLLVPQMIRLSSAQTATQAVSQVPVNASGDAAGIGDNNTLVDVPEPRTMGSGNTIVRTTDPNGNTIFNKGGVAIGTGARADATSIAIGAGAGAGNALKLPDTKQ